MKSEKIYRLITVAALALAMLAIGFNVLMLTASPSQAQQIKERFSGILVDHDADINGDLDVDGTANLDNVDIDGTVDLASTLDLSGELDMQNNIISNIGAAGTDFGADGSLTAAAGITATTGGLTATAGGLTVTAGGATITAGGLDVNGTAITVDVDADSTITADTDDRIDFAVGGTDSLTLTTTALVIEALGNTETANTTSGTQTVTPTTSVLSFAPSAVTTVTLGTPTGNIKHLLLYNKNTTNTVIVDTGATAGGGNVTLGQNDPVWFYWTGTLWMELLSPDNS